MADLHIIDYFQDENQSHWLAQIAAYEWRTFYAKNGFVPAELVVKNDYPCQAFVRKKTDHALMK